MPTARRVGPKIQPWSGQPLELLAVRGTSTITLLLATCYLPQFVYAQSGSQHCAATGAYYEYVYMGYFITWDYAKAAAEAQGGHLATITSAEEQACVAALSSSCGWIGATHSYNWEWVTGETWSYSNWQSGEPGMSPGHIYVSMNWPGYYAGKWDDWSSDSNGNQYGYFMEWDYDHCADAPYTCQGTQGSCVNTGSSYYCDCYSGYTGSSCETNIDECATIPCHNGGVCIDGVNNYTCTCDAGITGINCELVVECPIFSSGSVPGTAGTGGQSGCTVDAGIASGTVVATNLPPYYVSTLEPTSCPFGSAGIVPGTNGTFNTSGCTTSPGYSGAVFATTTTPFFNSTLAVCELGHYSGGGGSPCVVCNDGYTTNTLAATGASTCEPCPVGFYSPASTVACAECPLGSIVNSAYIGATICEPCPAGKYATSSDGTSSTCGSSPNNMCENCNVGEFSPPESSMCTNCATLGLEDLDQDPATACEQSTCTQVCEPNFEDADCDIGTECTACMSGQFTDGGNSTNSLNSCAPCTPGTYEVEEQCTPCPVGRFKSVVGSLSCLYCPAGRSGSTAGATDVNSCEICNTGQYSAGGADTCMFCESGKADIDHNASTPCTSCAIGSFAGCGAVDCDTCIDGTTDADFDPSTPCTTILGDFMCPAGTFCAILDCSGQNSTVNDCFQCPAGHVGTDGLSCTLCTQPNMVSNEEHTACVPCSATTTPVIDRSRCVCDISQAMYNVTGMHVHCFDNHYKATIQTTNAQESCQICPLCLYCSNGSIALKAGYQALLSTSNETQLHYFALRCPIESACLSQHLITPLALTELPPGKIVALPAQSCEVGARGRLCADCEAGYSYGPAGPCIECVAGSAVWWAWAVGAVIIIGVIYTIVHKVMATRRKKRQKRQEDSGVLFRYLASQDFNSAEGSISRSTLVKVLVKEGMPTKIALEVVETIDIIGGSIPFTCPALPSHCCRITQGM